MYLACLNQWTGLLDWTTRLDYWTGLLDWPLNQQKSLFSVNLYHILFLANNKK